MKQDKVSFSWQERLYCCLLFFAIVYRTLQFSMLKYVVNLPYSINWFFIMLCIGVCLAKKYKKSEVKSIAIALIVLFVGFVSYHSSNSLVLISTIAFLYAAKGMSFRKIVKTYKIALFFSILLVVLLHSIGALPSTEYYRSGTNMIRYTFGFTHPNVFSFHVLAFVFSSYFTINAKDSYKVNFISVCPCLFALFITFFYSRSYTVSLALLIFLFVLCFDYIKLFYSFIERHKSFFQGVSVLLVLSVIALVIYMSYNYSRYDFVNSLGNTTFARLLYSNRALHTYGISLFGQKIDMVNSLSYDSSNYNYFMIDCLYILLLVRDGLVASVIFWFLIIRSTVTLFKSSYFIPGIIIMIMIIYSIMETGMSYNCYGYIFIPICANMVCENVKVKKADCESEGS